MFITINDKLYNVPDGASIQVRDNQVFVAGKPLVDIPRSGSIYVHVEGSVGSIETSGDVRVAMDVKGSVNAGGTVVCGNVGANVNAGGNVSCYRIEGEVAAGGNINVG